MCNWNEDIRSERMQEWKDQVDLQDAMMEKAPNDYFYQQLINVVNYQLILSWQQ